ncbi:MAG: pitrilysin family protein [Acidobacteriota bacterium]
MRTAINNRCLALALMLCCALPTVALTVPAPPAVEMLTQRQPASPLIAVRLLFEVGSADDPAGKEGLACLTSAMIGQAATSERSFAELVEALYPMAAAIEVSCDREVTVISGSVHRDHLEAYTELLLEALLRPAFAGDDFERNRELATTYLTANLRSGSDELLGLEALQGAIFADHPYQHPPLGTVQGLAAIGLDDIQAFYRSHYVLRRLIVGLGGGFPESYPAHLETALRGLPEGKARVGEIPAPKPIEGRHFRLIEKETASVGIHLGFPLPLDRSAADYYPLMVANSFLGEHRTFHGRLMQQLRGVRGLNYGDYSYIEYYDSPPFTSNPTPNVPRRQQYFSVWVRPVVPKTAHFALRAALSEVDRLIDRGLTEEEFELTRDFLINYSKLWARSFETRLGFELDSRYYGMPSFIAEIERRLRALTVEEVNAAVRKYLSTDDYVAVLVTGDGDGLRQALVADEASPITYEAAVPEAIQKADREIEKRPIEATRVEVIPVSEMFEGGPKKPAAGGPS